MNSTSAHTKEPRTTASVVNELVHGLQNLLRGEIQLARAEVQNSVQSIRRNMTTIILFTSIAMVGVLPFMAFLVIGLGKLLNDRYWLSSLIVSVVFMGIGGAVAFFSYQKLKKQDFTLPATRHSFQEETQVVRGRLKEVTEPIQRRAA